MLLSAGLALIVAVAARVEAAPTPTPEPKSAPEKSLRRAAPVMPSSFDKATVQNLIDNIEMSGNAPILKVGYFNVRKPQVLPMREGYDLIVQAVEKEPKGTKRWFLLQQVRAWGGVRLPVENEEDGKRRNASFQVYAGLFDKADLARKNNASGVLLRTVYEYVQAVPTRHIARNLQGPPSLMKDLQKALRIYLDALMNNERVVFVPDWKNALTEPGWGMSPENFKPFLKVADDAAKNAKGGSRKRVLEAKAAVYAAYEALRKQTVS